MDFFKILPAILLLAKGCVSAYYGSEVCTLSGRMHGVSGTVYLVDNQHLFIQNFNYDGKAPDAFFYFSSTADRPGTMIPHEGDDKLSLQVNEGVLLKMPGTSRVSDIKWFSVWCRSVAADLGSCNFPATVTVPAPVSLGVLPAGKHGTSSSTVTVLNSRTLSIEGFFHDGRAPDTHFVLIKGNNYNPATSVTIPDENGSMSPLGAYNGRRIEIMVRSGVDITDFDWFSVYCISVGENFAQVAIPQHLSVPPVLDDIRPDNEYHGVFIGALSTMMHGVSGRVYVVDERTLFIKNFNYDGKAPDSFFYFGSSGSPSGSGIMIPDEKGRTSRLEAYQDACLVLKMPAGYQVTDIRWLSVWCRSAVANMGSLDFPTNLDTGMIPASADIGSITGRMHGVQSGAVTVVDMRTVEITDFSYDGQAPDTYFVLGKGDTVEFTSTSVKVPDENGNSGSLSAYSSKTIQLMALPGVNIADYDWLSVYCISVAENLGHILIPDGLTLPPCELDLKAACSQDLPNCMVLDADRLCVAWGVSGNDITIELRGVLEESDSYMAFGLSGDPNGLKMVGSDVTVAYYDTFTPTAEDYFLSAKSQCSRNRGACPDRQNDVTLVGGSKQNGMTYVRYKRRLATADSEDLDIATDREMAIVWAMGRLNDQKLVTYHTIRSPATTKINFGRMPMNSCPEGGKVTPPPTPAPTIWPGPSLSGKDVKTFVFRIGPSGGRSGYEGITGQLGWGIAFYVNDLLIPEITLVVGETYTFIIETGGDPSKTADYHPVYISDDSTGGYVNMNAQQRQQVNVFAGLDDQGRPTSEAVGSRYCRYEENGQSANSLQSFDAYFKTLDLTCEHQGSGFFQWTPTRAGLYYYQCYQHRYLGWKINVVDRQDAPPSSCETRCRNHCNVYGDLPPIRCRWPHTRQG